MQEIWKDILNYEGLYQVSNLGRVKSLERITQRFNGFKICNYKEGNKILKQHKDSKGYLRIWLCKNGKQKNYKIHRLVAEAFIPNPENKPQVNHKDENKQNNYVNNLEWCDNEYNARYSNSIPVIQYDLKGNVIKKWECIMEIERKLNIKNNNVVSCCKGKRKTAGGYIWKYKDAT